MRRDGGSVFPAHANTGDPTGPFEVCPTMRSTRADIHDGPEQNSSNQRPDTLMQDHLPPARRKPLATHGRTIHRVIRVVLTGRRPLPVLPDHQTFSGSFGMSQKMPNSEMAD